MTMKILLTAAAIISSTGFGISQTPAGHDSIQSSCVARSGERTQSDDPRDALDARCTRRLDALDASMPPTDRPISFRPSRGRQRIRRIRSTSWRAKLCRAETTSARQRSSTGFPNAIRSRRTPDKSLYYEAFALYRSGGDDDLEHRARSPEAAEADSYPKISKSDGAPLLIRVCGELAKRGDQECAEIDRRRGRGQ